MVEFRPKKLDRTLTGTSVRLGLSDFKFRDGTEVNLDAPGRFSSLDGLDHFETCD
jgi:hypothetical protein